MPKFAANVTWMFNEMDFPARFAAAAAAGFRAVEMQFPYAHEAALLKEKLAQNDLRAVLFNMPPGDTEAGEYGLAGLPGREAEFHDSLGLALEYARALGCPRLHMLAGIVPAGESRERCLETYLANVDHAAKACAGDGITVMLEPINTFDRPRYLIALTAQARDAMARVGRDNIAIQYDVHNAQLMEGNLTRTLTRNIGLIGHMQVAGLPDRSPPDAGEINYPHIFRLIDELGYEGWVGCEYRPPGKTVDSLGWARDYGIG